MSAKADREVRGGGWSSPEGFSCTHAEFTRTHWNSQDLTEDSWELIETSLELTRTD